MREPGEGRGGQGCGDNPFPGYRHRRAQSWGGGGGLRKKRSEGLQLPRGEGAGRPVRVRGPSARGGRSALWGRFRWLRAPGRRGRETTDPIHVTRCAGLLGGPSGLSMTCGFRALSFLLSVPSGRPVPRTCARGGGRLWVCLAAGPPCFLRKTAKNQARGSLGTSARASVGGFALTEAKKRLSQPPPRALHLRHIRISFPADLCRW